MSGPVNSKILGSDQIFKLLDKNGNGNIEKNELNEMTSIFGLKKDDQAINAKKVQNYEQKASLLTSVLMQNDAVTIDGDENVVIVTHGDENESSITIPEDKTGTFTADGNNFPEEIQLSMIKKGLDPAAVAKAGFSTVDQKVVDGKTIMTLRSDDGYNLEISDQQVMTEMLEDGTEKVITDSKGNPKMATIARDENGNLVLDGVKGSLTVTPSTARSHEVILSNVYDNGNEFLTIDNKSGVPLTRTYPADDKGNLTYDAAFALDARGFYSEEARSGAFTKVSITEDPTGRTHSNIHLESSHHGFVIDANGDSPQWQEMSMTYGKDINGNKTLIVKSLSDANIAINEDDSPEHNLRFSNVDRVHAENKTTKPVNLKRLVMETEDGKENDNSSFTYSTTSNFDTYQQEYTHKVTTSIHTDGTLIPGTQKHKCACEGSRHSWTSHTGRVIGGIDMDLEWGTITKTSDKIKLAPNDSYLIQPKGHEYSVDEKKELLDKNNKSKIQYIDIHNYLKTKEELRVLQDQSNGKEVTLDNSTKIGRSGRSWNGLGVNVTIEDKSVKVKGDNNKVIAVFGDNNIAHIGPDKNGNMSDDARTAIFEMFHLDDKMFSRAGFNDVQIVRNTDGSMKEVILTNKDGTKLTMPSDEAYLFSDQMSVTKTNGVYHISNLVGTLEGTGMQIDCTDSNVDINVIEHDAAKGKLVYRGNIEGKGSLESIHINYSTDPKGQANVFKRTDKGDKPVKKMFYNEVGGQYQVQKKNNLEQGTRDYDCIDITFISQGSPYNRRM